MARVRLKIDLDYEEWIHASNEGVELGLEIINQEVKNFVNSLRFGDLLLCELEEEDG